MIHLSHLQGLARVTNGDQPAKRVKGLEVVTSAAFMMGRLEPAHQRGVET